VLVSLVACIPLIRRYFSMYPIVLERMYGAIPRVGLYIYMLVNGLMCAGGSESLLIVIVSFPTYHVYSTIFIHCIFAQTMHNPRRHVATYDREISSFYTACMPSSSSQFSCTFYY